MSRIHFIGGEKGGVGKSVLARLLAQYHIDKDLPFAAFDTDRSHGALLRFYAESSTPIVLEEVESTDLLMESALDTERNVLVDLAAQTSAPLHRWIDQADLMTLARDEGIPVVFWHVIDDGADGITLLDGLLDRYGDTATYVVVCNYGRGRDFSAYHASAAHAKAEALGAYQIDMPELNASSMRRIDHGSTSLWAAVNNKESGLGLMDRQRVRVWIKRAYQQLDKLHDRLLAPADV